MGSYRVFVQVLLFSVVIAISDISYISGDQLYEFIAGQWVTTPLNQSNSISEPVNKINIKVYYETLCPGSINFITNQLRPATEKLAPYLDIHLVPYGHARTKEVYGEVIFECQHGPLECYGNRIHACTVDVLKNGTEAARFNSCLMEYANYRKDSGFDYTIVVNWCNYKLNIRTPGIWACINGERGSALLKAYGDETRAVGLRYIPYILVENSTEKQDEATRDLTSTLCRMLQPPPPVCYQRNY